MLTDYIISKRWINKIRLELILMKGASGEYGDFSSINLKSLRDWVKGYYQSNQNEIDREIRSYQVNEVSSKESDIMHWYNEGIKRFVGIYDSVKQEFEQSGKEEMSYHSVPEDVDYGGVWWKVFEEAGIVDFDEIRDQTLVKQVKFKLEREANNNSEFVITIPERGIFAKVKTLILRKEIAKWIMQGLDINDLFNEYDILSIRKKNFFEQKVEEVKFVK